jgi:hypothetical protein
VLGYLVSDTRSLHLDDLVAHPKAIAEVRSHTPPIRSFLRAPVRAGAVTCGVTSARDALTCTPLPEKPTPDRAPNCLSGERELGWIVDLRALIRDRFARSGAFDPLDSWVSALCRERGWPALSSDPLRLERVDPAVEIDRRCCRSPAGSKRLVTQLFIGSLIAAVGGVVLLDGGEGGGRPVGDSESHCGHGHASPLWCELTGRPPTYLWDASRNQLGRPRPRRQPHGTPAQRGLHGGMEPSGPAGPVTGDTPTPPATTSLESRRSVGAVRGVEAR